jgi:putative phosphoesterase
MVYGNNDGEKIGLDNAFKELGTLLPGPRIFSYNGKSFFLTHEHVTVDAIRTSQSIDVIVYGHTHEVDIRKGKPLVVNPGEAGGWLKGKATIAVLDTVTMEVDIIELSGS